MQLYRTIAQRFCWHACIAWHKSGVASVSRSGIPKKFLRNTSLCIIITDQLQTAHELLSFAVCMFAVLFAMCRLFIVFKSIILHEYKYEEQFTEEHQSTGLLLSGVLECLNTEGAVAMRSFNYHRMKSVYLKEQCHTTLTCQLRPSVYVALGGSHFQKNTSNSSKFFTALQFAKYCMHILFCTA